MHANFNGAKFNLAQIERLGNYFDQIVANG